MGLLQMLVRLGLDATGYEVGFKRVRSTAREFSSELTNELGRKITGVFSFAALEEGARRAVEFGSKIQDLSDKTGISTDDLQIFDFAAHKAGTSLESVTSAVEKLQIAQNKARVAGPDSDIYKSLLRLGLKPEQIGTLEAAEAFRAVGDQIKNVDVITGQLQQDMRETMGKGALDILGVFRNDLRSTGDELRGMGGIIPAETIAKFDELDDTIHALGVTTRSWIADMMAGFKSMTDAMVPFISRWSTVIEMGLKNRVGANHSWKEMMDAGKIAEKAADEVLAEEKQDREQRHKNKKYELAETDEHKATHELNEVARIHERILEIKRKAAMEGMTDAEKLKQLELEKQKIAEEMGPRTRLEDEKAQLRLAEIEEEKAKILGKEKLKDEKGFAIKTQSDSFVSIGNLIGVDPNKPVVDKLEVLHFDLQQVVAKLGGGSVPQSNFPSTP